MAVFQVRPIGFVEKRAIRIHKRYSEALDGIEGFSHIIVVSWLHEAGKPSLRLHARGRKDLPLLGTLATRSSRRFNSIGLTVVPLLSREGNVLKVKELDLWDGTPIIDVKPYTKRDRVEKFRVPAWVKLLDQAETDPLRRYAN